MKKHAKKIILGLLTLILIYIWWGNIQTFTQNESYYAIDTAKVKTESEANSNSLNRVVFKKPKVNPFAHEVKSPPSPTQQPVHVSKPPVKQIKLASQFTLTGMITNTLEPQLIIKAKDQKTFILTLGDSLLDFRFSKINDSLAIFSSDTGYDTLYLQ